jgi:hypothetical protein
VPALERFAQLQAKGRERRGEQYPLVVIHEAGLDGFLIHRCLMRERIESHLVDAASIAASRRSRRAKTDKLDGEALVRRLLAYKRGEPRVFAMVTVPSVEDGASGASSARWWSSAYGTSTGSRVYCSRKGSATTNRCAPTGGCGWRRCAPAMAERCRSM